MNTEKSTLLLSKISIVYKKFSFGNVFSVYGVFGLFTDVLREHRSVFVAGVTFKEVIQTETLSKD